MGIAVVGLQLSASHLAAQRNDAGQVELKLETPWRDGTTHSVISSLEFMQRREIA